MTKLYPPVDAIWFGNTFLFTNNMNLFYLSQSGAKKIFTFDDQSKNHRIYKILADRVIYGSQPRLAHVTKPIKVETVFRPIRLLEPVLDGYFLEEELQVNQESDVGVV